MPRFGLRTSPTSPPSPTGRTAVLMKPVEGLNGSSSSTERTDALVSSAPLWQLTQRPSLVNTRMPRSCSTVSLPLSNGVSFAIKVDSYDWIARPQNREKFASITVNEFGQPPPSLDSVLLASTQRLEFHHTSWKAAFTMSAYEVFNPGPLPFDIPPNTLSSVATICWASGICTWRSIFLPNCKKLRPFQDISTLLFGGPTAWDAALALSMLICT